MATFHVQIKSARPGQALRHLDYITRRTLPDHDLKEVVVAHLPPWSKGDPRRFFSMADRGERANGAAYRELEVSVLRELTQAENMQLVRKLCDEVLGGRPRVIAYHETVDPETGATHPHVHAMYSDRPWDGIERKPEMHFRRANSKHPERGGAPKLSGGKNKWEQGQEIRTIRERAAKYLNAALEEAGHEARVDHRSHKDRGLTLSPATHVQMGHLQETGFSSPDTE